MMCLALAKFANVGEKVVELVRKGGEPKGAEKKKNRGKKEEKPDTPFASRRGSTGSLQRKRQKKNSALGGA